MNKQRKCRIPWYILFGFLYVVGASLIALCSWYHKTYDVGFKELLYTLLGPLEGAGNSVIRLVINSFVPPFLWAVAILLVACFLTSELRLNHLLWQRVIRRPFPTRVMTWLRRIGAVLCVGVFIFSLAYVNYKFTVTDYLRSLQDTTQIYEEEYVDPAEVAITAPEKKRNLIYIYLESMEITYTSPAEGGVQETNLLPRLTALAQENLHFAGTNSISGLRSFSGLNWTMASLLGQTAGIPFAFPVSGNAMDTVAVFAPKMTNLGDILQQNGYTQEFLCGSDASYAGRRKYFTQHGDYQIYDLFTAREQGVIDKDYYVWWGFEDSILFDIARSEATRLSEGDAPFNLTLLTVDLHHLGGYVCDQCSSDNDDDTANVVTCTDRQVADFIDWCRQQPFFEDTTIVLVGDHPRMDTMLVEGVGDEERALYHCILNAAAPVEGSTENRLFTALDMFPTTLSALGFDIEGDRLGLGVDLFSTQPTLAERLGIYDLELELNKESAFYLNKFFYAR